MPPPARLVQEPLVLQRGQLPSDVDLAELLVAAKRQLERRTFEMVHQDERVVRVDARMLGRGAEEVVGMGDHELIEGRTGGDENGG